VTVTLYIDLHHALQPEDVVAPKAEQLRDPQPQTGLRDEHCPAASGHRIGQSFNLLDRQRDDLVRFVGGQGDA
jgi:hypothetical protein